VHATPAAVSAPVLELALDVLGDVPRSVCDPACGAGAFLVAAADALVARGVPAHEVVTERLHGMDVDAAAVAEACVVLARWAAEHGAVVDPDRIRVQHGDALAVAAGRWPQRPPEGFDLVVGNPPFLSQLSSSTSRDGERRRRLGERFGEVGAYTDDAALFLLAGVELVAPGGVVAMVQPQSVLSARDAGAVRDRVLRDAALDGLWAHGGSPFPDADVAVCAPALRRRHAVERDAAGSCEVRWEHGAVRHRSHQRPPSAGARWGTLLAPALGVPDTPPCSGATVGTVATATAGFRDEFYALADCTSSASPTDLDAGSDRDASRAPLVSVGMIDPLQRRWDTGEHRVAGRRLRSPMVDLVELSRRHPRVARWAAARRVPKVLVATQTKVVEAWADPSGDAVPLTPVISVEPLPHAGLDVWHLVAALSAPPVAAAALREHVGAGRSAGVLRWSASAVCEAALPVDSELWARGADLARELQGLSSTAARNPLLDELAVVMTRAHGLSGEHPVVSWWSMRRPRR
jgi:hypothetical protein